MSSQASTYRPEVGTTIFVSSFDQQPTLITVTGYHMDARFAGEQIDFIGKDGRKGWTSLAAVKFFPDVPADAKFISVAEVEEHEHMESSNTVELGYFFDPQSAFDYIAAVEAGTIEPRHKPSAEFVAYSVRVVKA